jgi:uncharacterized protein
VWEMASEPPSPCNGVCRIDPASGWCLGCRRTLGEIAEWSGASDGRKRAILEALDGRAAGYASPPHGAQCGSAPTS